MKPVIGISAMLLFSPLLLQAQSEEFLQAVKEAREDGKLNGYTIIYDESAWVEPGYALWADVHTFYDGYDYVFAFYVDYCSSCHVKLSARQNGQTIDLNASVERSGDIARASYFFSQKETQSGDICGWVDNRDKYWVTALLFRKSGY